MSNEDLEKKIDKYCEMVCNKASNEYCEKNCPFAVYCGNGKNGFEEFLKGEIEDGI